MMKLQYARQRHGISPVNFIALLKFDDRGIEFHTGAKCIIDRLVIVSTEDACNDRMV